MLWKSLKVSNFILEVLKVLNFVQKIVSFSMVKPLKKIKIIIKRVLMQELSNCYKCLFSSQPTPHIACRRSLLLSLFYAKNYCLIFCELFAARTMV